MVQFEFNLKQNLVRQRIKPLANADGDEYDDKVDDSKENGRDQQDEEKLSLVTSDQNRNPPIATQARYPVKESILIILCCTLFVWQYSLGLRGGTLHWLNEHMFEIVFNIVSSLIMFLGALAVLIHAPAFSNKAVYRAPTGTVLAIVLIATIAHDQGADLDHHGSFNQLLFLFILVPVLFIWTVLAVLFRTMGLRRGLTLLLLLFIISSLWFGVQARKAQIAWAWGLHGRHMDDDLSGEGIEAATCRVVRPDPLDIPVPDILRVKPIFDMFIGKDECPIVPQFSTITNDGTLILDCAQVPVPVDTPSLRTKSPTKRKPPRVCPEKHLGVVNNSEWPLQLCTQQPSGSIDQSGWYTAAAHVFEQFEEWEDIPFNVRKSISPESYAETIQAALAADSVTALPQSFIQSGGLLSTQCTSSAVENFHLVAPKPQTGLNCEDYREQENKMDVMILLIDALGRTHAHRKLPLTMKTLENITRPAQLGKTPWTNTSDNSVYSFEFFRYHSVGFNTGPNSGALFAGEKGPDDAMTNPEGVGLPTENMMWNILKDASNGTRATSMIHEICQHWGYTYARNATNLDHHMYLPFCGRDAFPHPKPFGNFEGPFSTRKRCMSGKQVHEHTLGWVEGFIESHNAAGVPWFMVAWLLEAHEMTGDLIQVTDERISKYFSDFLLAPKSHNNSCTQRNGEDRNPDNALNHTIQFLLADHGLHMGPFAMFSPLGNTENKLPSMFVTVPSWFLRAHPKVAEALTVNQYRLVSSFDVYKGIVSLRHLSEFGGNGSSALDGMFKIQPPDRTCVDAGVSERSCACDDHPTFK